MTLLLAILSVIAAWAFLLVLAIGLLIIWKELESVRAYLERITMGVRAIERETGPLGAHAGKLADELDHASREVGRTSSGLAQVDNDLGTLASQLRPGEGR